MKKKWIPHIIAVGAFMVFIVLGLACASLEASQPENTGEGGYVRVQNTSSRDYWYYVVENDSMGSVVNTSRIRAGETGPGQLFRKNSDYVVRYGIVEQKDQNQHYVNVPAEQIRNWGIKRGNISNGERITVNIP